MTEVAIQLALIEAPTVLFPGIDEVLREGAEKNSGTCCKVYQVQRLLGLKVGSKEGVGEWSTTAQAVFEWKLGNVGVRLPDRKTFLKENAKVKKGPGIHLEGEGEASSSSDRPVPMQADNAALTRAAGDDDAGDDDNDSEDDQDAPLDEFVKWMVQNRNASKEEIRAKCFETVWQDDNTVLYHVDVGNMAEEIITRDDREWIDKKYHYKVVHDYSEKVGHLRCMLELRGVDIRAGYGIDYDPLDAQVREAFQTLARAKAKAKPRD